MGTLKKQKQIRLIMEGLNWGYRNLAHVLYEELYFDNYEGIEIKERKLGDLEKFSNKLKKQLSRISTSEELLSSYLEVITNNPDYQAAYPDRFIPKYVKHQCLDEDMFDEIINISNELDKK